MKKSITIGLTVFNEEKNIAKLLKSLLNQDRRGFSLENIYVISDGSTDRTNSLVNKMAASNPLIILKRETTRRGKPARINQLFTYSNADGMVILDGDITIRSRKTISRLVAPILNSPGYILTSGKAHYLTPKSFFERIMKVGNDMWCEVKERTVHAEMYTCEGQIRAFSRPLYKKLEFPPYSADDVFPYLYVKKNAYNYVYVPEAKVYYGLPSNLQDFVKQHTRYLLSKAVQSKTFTQEMVSTHYVIGLPEKASTYIRYFFKKPFSVSLYTLFLVLPKIEVRLDSKAMSAKWSIITSTKK